jgi:hypothetical protein
MKKLFLLILALTLLSACSTLQPKGLPPAPTAEEEKAKAESELFLDLGLDAKGTIKKDASAPAIPSVFPKSISLPAIDAPANP